MGLKEMCAGLSAMSRHGYACAGILTHPGEFFRYRGKRCVPIRKNCRRLEQILDFVAAREDMQWVTIEEMGRAPEVPDASPPEIKANLLYASMRVVEQVLDRLRARI
jgi:hypothetical protein